MLYEVITEAAVFAAVDQAGFSARRRGDDNRTQEKARKQAAWQAERKRFVIRNNFV